MYLVMKVLFSAFPKKNITIFTIGLIGIIFGALGPHVYADANWLPFFDNLHWTSGTFCAAILAYLGYKNHPKKIKSHLYFMLAFVSYAVGQIIWDIQEIIGYSKFPSPSDFFYLLLGPFLTTGLIFEINQYKKTTDNYSLLLDILSLSIAAITIILVLYLPHDDGLDMFSFAILTAYPVSLFIPIFISIIMLFEFQLRPSPILLTFIASSYITSLSWMNWNLMALNAEIIDGQLYNVSFSIAILLAGLCISAWETEYSKSIAWKKFCQNFLRQFPIISILTASASIILVTTSQASSHIISLLVNVGAVVIIVISIIRQSQILFSTDKLIALQTESIAKSNLISSIVDTAPIAIFWKDRDLNYLGCNTIFAKNAGYQHPSEIIGKDDYLMSWKNEADLYRYDDLTVMQSASPKLAYEEQSTRPNGEQVWLKTWKIPLLDKSNEIIGILGIYADITEDKRLRSELKNYKDDLEKLVDRRTHELILAKDIAEKANLAKSEFLSRMSHELRTPLNSILGFSQLMIDDDSLNEEQKENVSYVLNAGNHLLQLITDILDLSKIESGQFDLDLEEINCQTILSSCLTLTQPLADAQHIQLDSDISLDAVIFANPLRFKQVCINLISNGIKYNKKGGKLKVSMLNGDNNTVKIIFTDTGVGIKKEHLTEIFKPFNRVENNDSKIEGTGIGLTITKRFVEEMNGHIFVESEYGVGSTFCIEFAQYIKT